MVSPFDLLCDYSPKHGDVIIANRLAERIASLPQEARDRLEAHINLEIELLSPKQE